MTTAVIVDAVRTPVAKGKPGGAYAEIHPVDLHAHILRALVERTGIDPAVIDDRQCGSSQQALHFAAQGVIAGAYDVAVASGIESMSRIPIGSQFAGKDFAGPQVHARY